MNIYYFAYGTNLNKKIFLKRFKNAKLIEKYTLKNYKVVFRTKYIIPDLQKKIKSKVQGLIYKIDKNILSKIFGIFLIIVSIRSFFEYLSIN